MTEDKDHKCEYRERYEALVTQLQGVGPEVAYWLDQAGSIVRLVRADFKAYIGKLLRVNFEVASYEVGTVEEIHDYQKKEMKVETKIVIFRPSETRGLEIIQNVEFKKDENPDSKES